MTSPDSVEEVKGLFALIFSPSNPLSDQANLDEEGTFERVILNADDFIVKNVSVHI